MTEKPATQYLIVFQYDLSSAHFADELQELAVLHFGVSILPQEVSQSSGVLLALGISLALTTDGCCCPCLGPLEVIDPLIRLLCKLICPPVPLGISLHEHLPSQASWKKVDKIAASLG